jgi:hypothetical protein
MHAHVLMHALTHALMLMHNSDVAQAPARGKYMPMLDDASDS